MRESYIENGVKVWARMQKILPLKMTPRGVVGYPDDFFFFRGHVAIIEFKAPGGVLAPIQAVRIQELQDMGFRVAVIRSIESGIDFLREVFWIMD